MTDPLILIEKYLKSTNQRSASFRGADDNKSDKPLEELELSMRDDNGDEILGISKMQIGLRISSA